MDEEFIPLALLFGIVVVVSLILIKYKEQIWEVIKVVL